MTQDQESELFRRVSLLEQDRDAHRKMLQEGGATAGLFTLRRTIDELTQQVQSLAERIGELEGS